MAKEIESFVALVCVQLKAPVAAFVPTCALPHIVAEQSSPPVFNFSHCSGSKSPNVAAAKNVSAKSFESLVIPKQT